MSEEFENVRGYHRLTPEQQTVFVKTYTRHLKAFSPTSHWQERLHPENITKVVWDPKHQSVNVFYEWEENGETEQEWWHYGSKCEWW